MRPAIHGPGIPIPSSPDSLENFSEELQTDSEARGYTDQDYDYAPHLSEQS